jgi:hypothetical protein
MHIATWLKQGLPCMMVWWGVVADFELYNDRAALARVLFARSATMDVQSMPRAPHRCSRGNSTWFADARRVRWCIIKSALPNAHHVPSASGSTKYEQSTSSRMRNHTKQQHNLSHQHNVYFDCQTVYQQHPCKSGGLRVNCK